MADLKSSTETEQGVRPNFASDSLMNNWQLTVIAVIMIVAAITYLGPILRPLLTAIFIFYLIAPAVDWLKKRGVAEWLSYSLLFAFVVAVIGALVGVLVDNADQIRKDWPVYRAQIDDVVHQFGIARLLGSAPPPAADKSGKADAPAPAVKQTAGEPKKDRTEEPLAKASSQPSPDEKDKAKKPEKIAAGEAKKEGEPAEAEEEKDHQRHLAEHVKNGVTGTLTLTSEAIKDYIVGPTVGAVEFGIMTSFYLLFILLTAPKIPNRIRTAFPDERGELLMETMTRLSEGMTKYMEVKTAINFGLGLTVALVLAAFGVRFWPLWGLLMFALNYVTYIGSAAALVPPLFLAFIMFGPSGKLLFLAAVLIAVRSIWIDFLEVKLSGRFLNVDSIVLFVMMAYWGWVWGLIGLVLAVPMTTCVKMALEAVEKTRPLSRLMSEK